MSSASSHLIPTSAKSAWNVRRHVVLGRPFRRLPLTGVQFMATRAGPLLGKHKTCAAVWNLCSATVSDNLLEPALCRISSFVMWSRYVTCSIFRRQRWWKTFRFWHWRPRHWKMSCACDWMWRRRPVSSLTACGAAWPWSGGWVELVLTSHSTQFSQWSSG